MDRVGIVLIVVGVVTTVGILTAGVMDMNHKAEMIQQCVDDGRKAYECEAMFKSCDSTILMVK